MENQYSKPVGNGGEGQLHERGKKLRNVKQMYKQLRCPECKVTLFTSATAENELMIIVSPCDFFLNEETSNNFF